MTIEITDEIISKVNNLKQEQLYIDGKLNKNLTQTVIDIHNWYYAAILNQDVNNIKSTFKVINENLLSSSTYDQSLISLTILDRICNIIYSNKSCNLLENELRINCSNTVLNNIKKYNDASPQYSIATMCFIRDYFENDIYPEHESGYWLPNSKQAEICDFKNTLTTDNYIQELFSWSFAAHPVYLNKINILNTVISPDINTDVSEHITFCLQNLEEQESYTENLPDLEF